MSLHQSHNPRIKACFERLSNEGSTGMVPFITAGDPSVEATVDVMHALVCGGADIIELGMPFSDPMADGPTIQQSSERALARGVHLGTVLEMVRNFRTTDATTPVVLMGYLNPIEWRGTEAFIAEAAQAGADGLLVVDLPFEEATHFEQACKANQVDMIALASPTTTNERMQQIAKHASGYVYYVSMTGVTGAGGLDVDSVKTRIGDIKQQINVPVAVGFGIKNAGTAAQFKGVADAVVVGSALVNTLHEAGTQSALDAAEAFLTPMSAALHQASSS